MTTNTFLSSLGLQVRASRKARRISQSDLASRLGLNMRTIARIEKSGDGHVETLTHMMSGLGCRFVFLGPHTSDLETFLKQFRLHKHLSQDSVGQACGLTRQTIDQLERGKGKISSLSRVLAFYSVPLAIIQDGKGHIGKAHIHRNFEFYEGDCRKIMEMFEPASIDALISDPPFEIDHEWNAWDRTGIAFETSMWRQCFDLLRPGSFLLAFAAPRLVHRVSIAIEDAGFILRDPIAWLSSREMPLGALDLSKAIDRSLDHEREATGTLAKAGRKSSGGSKRLGVKGGYKAPAYSGIRRDKPVSAEAKKWEGWHTKLKSRQDIVVAMKPLSEATYAANALRHGVAGAFNIGATKSNGYFTSSTIFDMPHLPQYFNVPKAVGAERHGHPTAKPVELMEHLCRLVTPPGGRVLDPFAGSGSTGEAALKNGFRFVGIELDPNYAERAKSRLEHFL